MILKRTLTKKSILGFGKYKNETVSKLLGMKCYRHLISAYYKLSSIDYDSEILQELGIIDKWTINKPGVDKDKYVNFLIEKGYVMERNRNGINKMKKEKRFTKGYLQSKNHNK